MSSKPRGRKNSVSAPVKSEGEVVSVSASAIVNTELASREEKVKDLEWPPKFSNVERPVILPFSADVRTPDESTESDRHNGLSRARSGGNAKEASKLLSVGRRPDFGRSPDYTADAFSEVTSGSGDDHPLIHFTFPATLPVSEHLDHFKEGNEKQEKLSSSRLLYSVDTVDDPSLIHLDRMNVLPPGRIGKLRVHESGKSYMDINGLVFDVSNGIVRQQYEHFVSTSATFDNAEDDISSISKCDFSILGPVSHTLVVTSSLESMLTQAEVEEEELETALLREYYNYDPPKRARTSSESSRGKK